MINPFTGIEHKITDDGLDPECLSFKSISGLNGKTAVMAIPVTDPKEVENFDQGMAKLAKGLSEITGREIEWRHIIDNNCAVWGDFGFFIVKL